MKLLLPKQHGAWAMLLVPFLLGIGAGQASLIHIPLLIGWFFLYLATYPLLMVIKNKRKQLHIKWSFIYLIPAMVSLAVVLIMEPRLIYFGLALFPLFLINIYFSRTNNERALLNDFSAIINFSIGGAASYYAGMGSIDQLAVVLSVFTILFFVGSTFFVKTMIREKRNSIYKWVSWGFHGSIIIALLILGYPLFIFAYLPSLVRAIYLYGKKISTMKMGIIEIVNSVYFFVIILILL